MNIAIRKWKITDAEDLSTALNNKKILENLRDGLPFPYTTSDAEFYINSMLDSNLNDIFAWAITLDDIAVGSLGIFRKDNIHYRTSEVGYYLSEAHWGKGIVSKALEIACDYIFSNTDIIRIFAEPFSHNIGSIRVLEKCGFELEGILRKNAYKDEKIYDMAMYSLVK